MPNYVYRAREATGKPVKGAMAASTKEELVAKLHKMGYMATDITEALPGVEIRSLLGRLKPVRAEDMIMFYVQLANLINAQIPILTSLRTLNKQIENKRLREVVDAVARGIEAGDNFSQALARHPHVFPKLFVNMAKAGEASGELDVVLSRYSGYFEHQEDLLRKVKAALFYPLILLIAGIAVMLFIVTFVIPQFADIFMKAGMRLPLPTLILSKTGTWIKDFWYLALAGILAGWLGLKFYMKTEKAQFGFDRVKLKMPIFGPLHRKATISAFARTLGTLTGSGVPILESLEITKEVVRNKVLGSVIKNARNAVEKGEKISEPLKISGEFPSDCVQMISVGEESGDLAGMLDKIANFYDMSVGYAIKKSTTLIEPLFLVIMGSVIGFIMVSLLLPIFDMVTFLRR
jgi:type IV pilus assembly protein PilC